MVGVPCCPGTPKQFPHSPWPRTSTGCHTQPARHFLKHEKWCKPIQQLCHFCRAAVRRVEKCTFLAIKSAGAGGGQEYIRGQGDVPCWERCSLTATQDWVLLRMPSSVPSPREAHWAAGGALQLKTEETADNDGSMHGDHLFAESKPPSQALTRTVAPFSCTQQAKPKNNALKTQEQLEAISFQQILRLLSALGCTADNATFK